MTYPKSCKDCGRLGTQNHRFCLTNLCLYPMDYLELVREWLLEIPSFRCQKFEEGYNTKTQTLPWISRTLTFFVGTWRLQEAHELRQGHNSLQNARAWQSPWGATAVCLVSSAWKARAFLSHNSLCIYHLQTYPCMHKDEDSDSVCDYKITNLVKVHGTLWKPLLQTHINKFFKNWSLIEANQRAKKQKNYYKFLCIWKFQK